jgi:hypothetical protein
MAFANTQESGALVVDKMPTQLIKNWQQRGKKVLISVGGENGHWAPLFAHPQTFIESVASIIETNNLDGIDLDIEGYTTPPAVVASTISMMRQRLGKNRLIVVSPENVGVFPSPWYSVEFLPESGILIKCQSEMNSNSTHRKQTDSRCQNRLRRLELFCAHTSRLYE